MRVLVRDPGRLEARSWGERVEVVEGVVDDAVAVATATRGVDAGYYLVQSMWPGPEGIKLAHLESKPAAHPPRMTPSDRLGRPPAEVQGVISEEQFLEEASRCFSCSSCFGCQQCSLYRTTGCYLKLEEVGPERYLALSLDACEECGKCFEVCPGGFLEVSSP